MKNFILKTQTKGHFNETVYHYISNDKGIAFFMNPKKAFSFVLYSSVNMTKKEINTFFDKWIQTAIGPSESFNNRIQIVNI